MEEFELEPGEKITLLVRKHWIIFFGHIFLTIMFALLPIVLLFLLPLIDNIPTIGTSLTKDIAEASSYIRFGLALWWLLLWMGAYSAFLCYYLTVWIITTTRIVEIHQYGFFSRKVSSFLLNRVQDVTTDVEGFIPTLFSFGSLDVETAGRSEQFGMYDISRPQEIRDLIMREVAALNSNGQPSASGV